MQNGMLRATQPSIHFATKKAKDYRHYVPLHTSFVDGRFRARKTDERTVDTFNNCSGTAGSCPCRFAKAKKKKRKCDDDDGKEAKSLPFHRGHNSFIGTQTQSSPSSPTPDVGPGMRSESTLCRAKTKAFLFPKTLHVLTELASTTCNATPIFCKPCKFLLSTWANQGVVHFGLGTKCGGSQEQFRMAAQS